MNRIRKVLMKILATAAVAWLAVNLAEGMDDSLTCVEAEGRPVAISSCLVSGSDVVCEIKAGSVPSSDDGRYYVYANEVYEDGPTGKVVAKVDAGKSVSVTFPLNYNTEESNLSRKFLIAMKKGGRMVQVSDEHYITNPEALAAYTTPRMNVGIKGILPDVTKISNGELTELSVQQVVYNLSVDTICSDASVPGAIPFTYNGKTYYFDGTVISNYDGFVRAMNRSGIQVTMVILNHGTGAWSQDLIHPMAAGGADCPSYALNVANASGTDHLKAIGAFLGQRYSGQQGCGQVDNWIVGNEVNARTSWWYTTSTSLDFNVGIYAKAFRIIYNELKSMNANVRIYNSIDQEWNRKSNPGSFLAKEYLDRFNYYMIREGNIDWGLSYHPYNSPLYDPYAWNGPAVWVQDSLKTPYITMQNIDILIDYMHRSEFLNPAGEVRSISIAEIGYTSSFGDEKQEASIAYGYLKAASLPDVDSFILFRQTDDAHEMESHLALGLIDTEGNKKPAYEIYKNLGTANEASAKARASEIIGMDIDKMISENIVWTRGGNGVVQ
ncbi:MAG: DUF5722 domain-containing protein [Lachnospiraceae bacterium]|nr:DUF5722 domain-containing protein [Lachnospiraceae bacterium]MDD7627363.1 DUF5722 domain-containing protein [Lachnospiraceae bacterium]MDY4118869.1 DUF5722 domain-containing protein [Lachnospiraceae bacterium]